MESPKISKKEYAKIYYLQNRTKIIEQNSKAQKERNKFKAKTKYVHILEKLNNNSYERIPYQLMNKNNIIYDPLTQLYKKLN